MKRCAAPVLLLALCLGSPLGAEESQRSLPSTNPSSSPAMPLLAIAPSPLLAVDQNRASIVEGVVGSWKASLQRAFAEASPEKEAQLRATLNALRADRLLSASLAGTLDGLTKALASSEASLPLTQTAGGSLLKALGDANRDLVYTPINPCRIVDTRNGGGGFVAAGTDRDWNAARPGGNFTDQGGEASDCAIPSVPAALLANLAVTGSSAPGVLFASAFNQPPPTASTLNWMAGDTIANAVIVPLAIGQAKELTIFASSGTHVVIDVLGYFKTPGGTLGDITSVTAGTGMTGSASSGDATLSIASTYRLPQTCTTGQVPKRDAGNNWICGDDNVGGGGGGVTSLTQGAGIVLSANPITSTGSIAADTIYLQRRVSSSCSAGSIRTINADGTVICAPAGWTLWGNSGTNPFLQYLGTMDNQPLEIRVNDTRVMRYEPNAISPNVVGGNPNNAVTPGVRGATIGGGGTATGNVDPDFVDEGPNRVTDHFGTVAGGYNNRAGDDAGTTADAAFATVGGGYGNMAGGLWSTVSGGFGNRATALWSTIAGGDSNVASGGAAFVAGGLGNEASGNGSLAAGIAAKADQANCFVFGGWSGANATTCQGVSNLVRFSVDHGFSVEYYAPLPSPAIGAQRWFYVGDYFAGDTIRTWNSAHLTDAGVWVNGSSSRSSKTDFTSVDSRSVLAKVLAIPITTWRYKDGEGSVRHMGPMAEDFYEAFGIGYGPHTIADLDARGVSLAAIQGLSQIVQEKDREIGQLKRDVAQLKSLVKALAAKSR